ncbi:MAG: hypothetical protein ABL962_10480 [Fimbriimonadaceae bacterium]
MPHSISLSDSAYRAYEARAKQVGLTVDEYLTQLALSDEGFFLSPEMRLGIERGLAQAEAGNLVGFSQVREELAKYRAGWRKGR